MLTFQNVRKGLATIALCAAFAGCAFQNAMSRGDDALRAGNYDAAVAEFTHAVSLDPDSPEARARLEQAKRGAVVNRIATARHALERGDLVGAAQDAGQAQVLMSTDAEVLKLVDDVGNATLAAGEGLVQKRQFIAARALYADVRARVPSLDTAIARADAHAADLWMADLTRLRDQAQKAGRTADALLSQRMLIALQPTAVGRAQCAQLVQALRDRNEVIVGVAPLDDDGDEHGGPPTGPSNGPHGGPAPKPNHRGHVTKAFMQLGRGLAQVGTTQWLRVLSPDQAIKNERAILYFGFGEPRFTTDQHKDMRSAQYQTGVRQVPSPFYADKQRAVNDAERRLMDAENEVMRQQKYVEQYTADVQKEGDTPGVSTGAEQNLWNAQSALESARRNVVDERQHVQQAREELTREPPFRDEPVYATWTYEVITYVVRALTRVVAQIEWQGETLPATRHPLSVEAVDTTHAAQPPLGLAPDPITLPTERDMVGGLLTGAANELQQQVQLTFRHALETERAFAMTLDGDARVERLVTYLMMDATTTDPEVDALLLEVRGVPNASTLLDTCGAPAQ